MSAKLGYLLMNTGAPDAPTRNALKTFMKDFTEDPLKNNMSKFVNAPLINWIVLPQHLDELVLAYAALWTDQGFPMVHYCNSLAQLLGQKLGGPVAVGMAHGNPSYKAAMAGLIDAGAEEIAMIWMFPQHDTSKRHCIESAKRELKHLNKDTVLRVAPPFYDSPAFIEPQVEALKGNEDYILFNYHGLTTHDIKQEDPTEHHCLTAAICCNEGSLAHDTCYRFQCLNTSRSIAKAAGIPEERYSSAFQTRHQHGKWLTPHTEVVLQELPSKGHKHVTVISPAYVCDGLETLEEVGLRGKYSFLEAGGESFRMIPCLNNTDAGVKCIESLLVNADQWPVA